MKVVSHSTPVLLFCVVIIVIFSLKQCVPNMLLRWGFTFSETTFDVDENLPDFFNALKMSDKDWF